jgi:hypothetical protein
MMDDFHAVADFAGDNRTPLDAGPVPSSTFDHDTVTTEVAEDQATCHATDLVAAAGKKEGEGPDVRSNAHDGPIPLYPPLPKSEPYPVEALGPVLASAAQAIARKVQVSEAIAAQSVLAVASLAAQPLADVRLPFGQTRPLSLFFVTIAGSGDRKSTTDGEALSPVRQREAILKSAYDREIDKARIKQAAWAAEKRRIENSRSLARESREAALFELGPEPEGPILPILTAPDPTVEGLAKIWGHALASLGLFSAEGGQLIGGHGFSREHSLKTAAALSELWDGRGMRRLRAGDGLTQLQGLRLAAHLMVQPQAAAGFLSDPVLRDCGLLSRFLVAAPESLAGTRFTRNGHVADDAAVQAYSERVLSLLEAPWPLVEGQRNELDPRVLTLTEEAQQLWDGYADHVERLVGPDRPLASLRDVAGKSAEQAARIAGVLAIFENRHTRSVDAVVMETGITIAQWYLDETLRLRNAARIDPRLARAQSLLEWIEAKSLTTISVRDVLRNGPSALRTKAAAEETIRILCEHGRLVLRSERPRLWEVRGASDQ